MATWGEFRPTALLDALNRHRVDFVVIGGVAAITHGSSRLTQDLDITYATDEANLKALGDTLLELKARLREVDEDVPLVPDQRTLKRTTILTLDTSAGPLDLLTQPPGAPPYEQLRRDATRVTLDSASFLIASIDHLVAMKIEAGRPRDLGDIDELNAIRRLT
jgi:predicted nucleotidyltransferase